MFAVLNAGMERTPNGKTEEEAEEQPARDPQRLKGLGNEGIDAAKLDIAFRTKRCLMAVLLHRKKTQANRVITKQAKTIRRPKPNAAFSPTLKKWNPDSLNASSICPSTSADNLVSNWACTFAVGEKRVFPIFKHKNSGAVELI